MTMRSSLARAEARALHRALSVRSRAVRAGAGTDDSLQHASRTSRRWHRSSLRDAKRDRRANARPAITSRRSSRAWARGLCRDGRTCSCRSTSRPAAATAARSWWSAHSGSPPPPTWSRSPSPTMPRVSAPVVFAGYGIVVPESQNFGYDSYATLDVKDKAVAVFRYFPEDADKETKSILARYSDLRYKAPGRTAAGREGPHRGHRSAFAQRRSDGADHVRHGACRFRHSRSEHQRQGGRCPVRIAVARIGSEGAR